MPKSYLRAWCDPNTPDGAWIWMASKDGSRLDRKAPLNVFHKTDLYTIHEKTGSDRRTETSLQQLEGQFQELRRKRLDQHLPIGARARLTICAFTAAMHARTLASGERWKPFWQEVAAKARQMQKWAKNASPDQYRSAARSPALGASSSFRMTLDQMESYAQTPLKDLVPAALGVMTSILIDLDLAILETASRPGFITSDDPCLIVDPVSDGRSGPGTTSLMSPTIEIHLPISPAQCLLFNRRGKNGYFLLSHAGPLADSEIVLNVNRWTRAHAREFIVVNAPILLARWFV